MIQPILKQRSDTRIQGLYLAQGRDVPRQTFRCFMASATQPDTSATYWVQIGQTDRFRANVDFVNLDKELPPFLAQSRLNDDLQEGQYRRLTLLEGDTEGTATPVVQDSSGMIWELILSI